MRKYLGLIAGLSLIAFGSSGCFYDSEEYLYPPGVCDTADVKYSDQVTYIISNRCYDCHSNSTSAISGSDVSFEGYANISGYLSTNANYFLSSINHISGYTPMPKDRPKLSPCDIRTLEIWIQNGYPNN